MSDLKILKENGYEELEDLDQVISEGSLNMDELWGAVGQGDMKRAATLVLDAGYDLGEEGKDEQIEPEDIKDVIVFSIPDDILGDRYRVWVKVAKR